MKPLPTAAWLSGFIADLPTPFSDNDDIDWPAFAGLCQRQIEAGATAIVVGETAGEAATLMPDEHDMLVRAAVKTARGRIKVIAGAGSNSTSQAVALTRRAEAAGADAVLSVAPYYNKPTQAGMIAHFAAITDCTELPVILHDAPTRTARGLANDSVTELARLQQIIGLFDASGDVTRPLRLKSMLRPGFHLLSGDEATAFHFLTQGGDGCVSQLANLTPELCRDLHLACQYGRMRMAREISGRLTPLAAMLTSEGTPAALKYALSLTGPTSPRVRLPMVELPDAAKAEVAKAIAAISESATESGVETRRQRELSEL
jgi:4-hydroxy-tetrahydrodipicolinate synthase